MKAVVTAGLTPVGPLLQAFFVDYLYGQWVHVMAAGP